MTLEPEKILAAASTAQPAALNSDNPRGAVYVLVLFCTYVLAAVNLLEFSTHARWIVPGSALGLTYFSFLALYAGDREIGHWSRIESPGQLAPRKGEWIVGGWVVFMFVAYPLSSYFPGRFAMPHDLAHITEQAVAIFCGSRASKFFRTLNRGGKADQDAATEADMEQQISALLKESPAGMTAAEIAGKTGSPRRTVTRALAELLKEGLIVRISSSPRDPDTRYRLP